MKGDKRKSNNTAWLWPLAAVLFAALLWAFAGAAAALVFAVACLLCDACFALAGLIIKNKLSFKIAPYVPAVKGEASGADIIAVNRSRLIAPFIICRISAFNSITGETGDMTARLSADARSQNGVTIPVSSEHCGRVELTVKKAYITGPIGLIRLPIAAACSDGVLFLPKSAVAAPLSEPPVLRSADAEAYIGRGGDLTETYAIRDYLPGDSLKAIHQKLSYKLGRPVVREGSMPVSRELVIIWDKPAKGSASPECADALAEAVCGVCASYTAQGTPFTAVWDDALSGGVSEMRAESEDSFAELLPMLLRSGGLDCSVLELKNSGAVEFAHAVYASCYIDDERLSRLKNLGESFTVLLCDETAENVSAKSTEGGSIITFSPEALNELWERIFINGE